MHAHRDDVTPRRGSGRATRTLVRACARKRPRIRMRANGDVNRSAVERPIRISTGGGVDRGAPRVMRPARHYYYNNIPI